MTLSTDIVLQGLNGVISVVAFWAFFIFVRYINFNFSLKYEDLRPAIAVMALCAAESFLRLPIFGLRVANNIGYNVGSWINWSYVWGGCAVLIGFLCLIRVFSPQKWGVWSWILPLSLAIVVTGLSFIPVIWR